MSDDVVLWNGLVYELSQKQIKRLRRDMKNSGIEPFSVAGKRIMKSVKNTLKDINDGRMGDKKGQK